jgi:hypothetical protein
MGASSLIHSGSAKFAPQSAIGTQNANGLYHFSHLLK